jgi:hypothetical protein
MRRGLTGLAAVTAGAAALCLGAVALSSAQTIYVEVGTIKTTFSASIKPKALPKARRAPIAVRLSSKVVAKSGEHIPAIVRAKIGIDRSLTIDPRGIPACSAGQLENQTTEGAEAACSAAIVGSGSMAVEIALDGGAPIEADSRLLAFNGGAVGRTTTVLVHAYLTAPVSQALVVPITLTKLAEGGYGMLAQATIPKIAGGTGSLARFDLTLRRQVATAAGKKHGYLLARCSDGNFVFEPEVEFDDGNLARGLLAQGCNTTR